MPPSFVGQDNVMVGPASFFQSGGTLPLGAGSYVRREADAALVEALARGEYCYLLNSRQIGKSSLCVRAIEELRGRGIRVAFLDLTKFGGRNLTAEQWYVGMLREVGRAIGLSEEMLEYWKREADLGPMQRFFGALREVAISEPPLPDEWLGEGVGGEVPEISPLPPRGRGVGGEGPLVILIDEIDATKSLPFDTDEFFAGIRECYNRRVQDPVYDDLTFCLIGVATPSDLIRDPSTTPFNIGRRIELRDFTEEEAMPLAAGLGVDGERRLKRILYWTGGHPFLTQSVCTEAAAQASEPIDRIVERMFFHAKARETNVNLADVQNRLLGVVPEGVSPEEHRASVLDRYEQVRSRRRSVRDDETDPLVALLKLCGLARVMDGYLWVRNRIYFCVFDRAWVRGQMPGAELERQRRAARQATWRVGLVAIAVASAIGVAALVAVSKAREANLRVLERDVALARARDETRAKSLALSERDSALLDARTEASAKARALGELQVQQKKTDIALASAERASREAGRQQANAVQKASLAETERTLARANAKKYLAEKLRAEGKTAEASRNLTDALRLAYVANMQVVQAVTDSKQNWILAASSIKSPELAESPFKGWEWGYWDREFNQQLVELQGHTGQLWSAAFSPDGSRILTASADKSARIWDARTGRVLNELKGHADGVRSAQFSPDGARTLTVSWDGTARIWDTAKGRVLTILKDSTGAITRATFSPDGARVLTMSNHKMSVWDLASGQTIVELDEHNARLTYVDFSPDGLRIVTASDDNAARVWEVAAGRVLFELKGHTSWVRFAKYSGDGSRIVTASESTVYIWEAASGRSLAEHMEPLRPVHCASFSADGTLLVIGYGDGSACVWNSSGQQSLTELNGHTQGVESVSFSPDGSSILTGSWDGTARLWDVSSGRSLVQFKGHSGAVLSADFSSDGSRIVTASRDNTARVWNSGQREVLAEFKGHSGGVRSVSYSSDGTRLLTTSIDSTTRIWDAQTRRPVLEIKGLGGVQSAQFSPDGLRFVTVSSNSKVEVWDAITGLRKAQLPKIVGEVTSAAFSPDGSRVVTAALFGPARVWDAANGRPLMELMGSPRNYSAVYSPDGSRIVAGGADGIIRVLSAQTGRCLAELKGHASSVWSVAFSQDGSRIVTASFDGTARVWELATQSNLAVLRGHFAEVWSAAFSPDGSRIVTGSWGSIRIWDTITGRSLAELKCNDGPVFSAVFSPDGSRITSASIDGSVYVWFSKRSDRQ